MRRLQKLTAAVALAALVSGCSAISGQLAISERGSLLADLTLKVPQAESVLVDSKNEVDIFGTLVELYKLAKAVIVPSDDDAPVS